MSRKEALLNQLSVRKLKALAKENKVLLVVEGFFSSSPANEKWEIVEILNKSRKISKKKVEDAVFGPSKKATARAHIAKQIVLSKMRGQNILLEKYGLQPHDEDAITSKVDKLEDSNSVSFGQKLNGIEGKFTQHYFKQVLGLLPEKLRPAKRKKFKAYDGVNNIFNLAYEVLQWKVHRAIIRAKMEPYLGFLHSVQVGKPSLICDLQELYRSLVDDFVVQFCQGLKEKDFKVKSESVSRKRKGKREYLSDAETRRMMKELEKFFESKVDVPLIRHGKKQRIETLINEETLLLAKYLRNERSNWTPRIPSVQ